MSNSVNKLNVSIDFPLLTTTSIVKRADSISVLYDAYEGHWYGPVKLLVSVYNAILHHRLTMFALDAKTAQRLYANDRNWKLKTKATEQDAEEAIKLFINNGCIEMLFEGNQTSLPVYATCDELLIKEIGQTLPELVINKKMVHEYLNKF